MVVRTRAFDARWAALRKWLRSISTKPRGFLDTYTLLMVQQEMDAISRAARVKPKDTRRG